jgi:hypothetical protein
VVTLRTRLVAHRRPLPKWAATGGVIAVAIGLFILAIPGLATAAPGTATATTTPKATGSVTGPAVVSGPKVAPGYQTGPNALDLLGQSTGVEADHDWQVHLDVSAATPRSDVLRIDVYDSLTTRTDFDNSLSGHLSGEPYWSSRDITLPDLPVDTGGGVTLGIPVDKTATQRDLPYFQAHDQSGIYPVQIELLNGSAKVVSSLTTYLLFEAGTPAQTGFPKLDVALSLDLNAAPALPSATPPAASATTEAIAASTGQIPAASVASLNAEVAALGRHAGVPTSLTVTPQTADMLAAAAQIGSPGAPPAGVDGGDTPALAKATLSGLDGLVSGGDQLLPTTYVATSVAALSVEGLSSEIDRQFAAANSSLSADLHHVPGSATWVINGPLDPTTLSILRARGATKVIVPSADLRALPKGDENFTVAAPAELSSTSGPVSVDAADAELSSHFTNSSTSEQILDANQLLAELAMIQLETPSRARGVSVIPPVGWQANAPFLDTLLGGLTDNPLLQPVTADQLFAGVPTASAGLARTLAAVPGAAALAGTDNVEAALSVAAGYGAVLPQATAAVAELSRRILIAESTEITASERADILSAVMAVAAPLKKSIRLPGNTSITLTARKGNLPLTLFDDPSVGAHVQLRLTSDKLTFEPFTPPGGQCSQTTVSSETCLMTLSNSITPIKVPVEARTSGVFTLDVALLSPDGSLTFDTNVDTVRSTAVSGVGVVIIVLAFVGLAYWWIRNIRHGRRARQLVTVSDGDGEESGKDPLGEEPVPEDAPPPDVFADFFSSPAPEYPSSRSLVPPEAAPPVSPSRGGVGPKT